MTKKTIDELINETFGESVSIIGRNNAFGGDIADSTVLTLSNGEKVFLKTHQKHKAAMYSSEAIGPETIAGTGAIKTPIVYGHGIDEERNCSYILMEAIESGRKKADFWEEFGHSLAMMHKADTTRLVPRGAFGFSCDTYIGPNVQLNSGHSSWVQFFRSCRLMPQIKMASMYFDNKEKQLFDKLLEKLETLLIEPDHPSLLHGDLWGGNFMTDEHGDPVLIDPAVYIGNAEADIAMTMLFGGFSERFYVAYQEIMPFQEGINDRIDLYNLYHLLNHLNLFGEGYLPDVLQILYKYTK